MLRWGLSNILANVNTGFSADLTEWSSEHRRINSNLYRFYRSATSLVTRKFSGLLLWQGHSNLVKTKLDSKKLQRIAIDLLLSTSITSCFFTSTFVQCIPGNFTFYCHPAWGSLLLPAILVAAYCSLWLGNKLPSLLLLEQCATSGDSGFIGDRSTNSAHNGSLPAPNTLQDYR